MKRGWIVGACLSVVLAPFIWITIGTLGSGVKVVRLTGDSNELLRAIRQLPPEALNDFAERCSMLMEQYDTASGEQEMGRDDKGMQALELAGEYPIYAFIRPNVMLSLSYRQPSRLGVTVQYVRVGVSDKPEVPWEIVAWVGDGPGTRLWRQGQNSSSHK